MLLIRALIACLPTLSERNGLDGEALSEMETWLPRDSLRHQSSAQGCSVWELFLLNPAGFVSLLIPDPFQPLCFHESLIVTSHGCKGREGWSLQAHPVFCWEHPPNVSIISLIISFQPRTNAWAFQGIRGQQGASYVSKCRQVGVLK